MKMMMIIIFPFWEDNIEIDEREYKDEEYYDQKTKIC